MIVTTYKLFRNRYLVWLSIKISEKVKIRVLELLSMKVFCLTDFNRGESKVKIGVYF